jgi:ketosteroid isomerase-like protein
MTDAALAARLPEPLHAAVNTHHAEAIAAPCTHDATWQDPAAPHVQHGREGVRWFHRDVMFPRPLSIGNSTY